jgi:hypothetical protein
MNCSYFIFLCQYPSIGVAHPYHLQSYAYQIVRAKYGERATKNENHSYSANIKEEKHARVLSSLQSFQYIYVIIIHERMIWTRLFQVLMYIHCLTASELLNPLPMLNYIRCVIIVVICIPFRLQQPVTDETSLEIFAKLLKWWEFYANYMRTIGCLLLNFQQQHCS